MTQNADLPPPIPRSRRSNWIMISIAGAFAIFTIVAGVSVLGDRPASDLGSADYAFFGITAVALGVMAWQALIIRDPRPALEFVDGGAAIFHFPGPSRYVRWDEVVAIDVRQMSKSGREIVFSCRRGPDRIDGSTTPFRERVVLPGAILQEDPDLIAARLNGLI